jgi:hypothetical protein
LKVKFNHSHPARVLLQLLTKTVVEVKGINVGVPQHQLPFTNHAANDINTLLAERLQHGIKLWEAKILPWAGESLEEIDVH